MQQNFQRELDEIISAISPAAPPRLLLHACCAPCSSYVLTYLSRFFVITISYYNPNIAPGDEYYRRRDELKAMLSQIDFYNPVSFIEEDYNPEDFYSAVKGLENEPERGKRCEICFKLRLRRAALRALELECDYFCTTLSISPHKNAEVINAVAAEISTELGVAHLPADFKKRGGYQQSLALSRKYGLYRQDYCGCAFSMRQDDASSQQPEFAK